MKEPENESGEPANTGIDPAPLDRSLYFARYDHKNPSSTLMENGVRLILRLFTYMTVAITLLIISILAYDAFEFFRQVSVFDFLFGSVWDPFGEPKHFGIWPLLSGTLMTSLGACVVAIPLGVGMAIYLTQYAGPRTQEALGPIAEILGGIPSVVYGYFALTAITPLLKNIFPGIGVFNALSASIVVGIAIMPLISSLSAEALRQVPAAVRNAGHALGMRKIHVVLRVIVPGATSGIMASIILAFSRALGETMAVTLAAGASPNLNWDYLQSIQTITAFIVQISLGDTPAGSLEYYAIYALGLSLFVLTFIFNFIALRVVKRFREVY